VQLAVPDSNQVIDAACELAWKRAPHAGFRFTILTEKSHRQIKEWLQAAQGSNGNGSTTLAPSPSVEAVTEAVAELFVATDEALLNLAIKARDFTNADGVAVAMEDSAGIICRASLGSAPDMGVRIQTDRGLSGECLRTGEIVVCYDSDGDPRLDAAVARELNMRSAVIVPIGPHEAPAGLLEVFFTHPRAFNEAAVYALQELASTFFVSSEKSPVAAEPERAAPSVGLPQMASFSLREASPGFVICDVCGLENNDANQVCDRCDVPLPAALRYVDLNSPEGSDKSGLRREQARVEPVGAPGRSYRKKLLFMLLAAVIVSAWQARGKISADTHISSAPPTVIRFQVEEPTPQRQDDKPLALPAPEASKKEQAAKVSERQEPEVTVKTFSSPATQPRSKTTVAKPRSKSSASKTATASSTLPQPGVAQQVRSGESEQTIATEQPIVLPLDDQDIISAVSTPPPAPAKPKQPSLWKRIGKKMIFRGGNPETEKK
jgi:hypothetical protein